MYCAGRRICLRALSLVVRHHDRRAREAESGTRLPFVRFGQAQISFDVAFSSFSRKYVLFFLRTSRFRAADACLQAFLSRSRTPGLSSREKDCSRAASFTFSFAASRSASQNGLACVLVRRIGTAALAALSNASCSAVAARSSSSVHSVSSRFKARSAGASCSGRSSSPQYSEGKLVLASAYDVDLTSTRLVREADNMPLSVCALVFARSLVHSP